MQKSMLLTNIRELWLIDTLGRRSRQGTLMANPELLADAWLLIENERIAGFGQMNNIPEYLQNRPASDCSGRIVFPAYCDSHTHLIFAQSREQEFLMQIQGKSYEEIAAAGGGILNSAQKLQQTSEEALFQLALERIRYIETIGTGAIEIKSGYGLTVSDELKMLRVARRLQAETSIKIRTTLLAAHALPPEYKNNREQFIQLICKEMIPLSAQENLADFVDVFCETGFFTPQETAQILECADKFGIAGKVHANELDYSGGVQVAVQANAVSADHLECVGEAELLALKQGQTIATVLPATSFFLRIPYAPARKLIQENIIVAIASDFNPGTAPSANMNMVLALACIHLRMLPGEALTAATLHGAAAMNLHESYGSLQVGKIAALNITKPLPSFSCVPYYFGHHLIDTTILPRKIIGTSLKFLSS